MIVNSVDHAPFRVRLKEYYARWRAVFGDTAWQLLENSVGKLG